MFRNVQSQLFLTCGKDKLHLLNIELFRFVIGKVLYEYGKILQYMQTLLSITKT